MIEEKNYTAAVGNRCSISDSTNKCFDCSVVLMGQLYIAELQATIVELQSSLRITRKQRANLWQNISKYETTVYSQATEIKKLRSRLETIQQRAENGVSLCEISAIAKDVLKQ